MCEVHEIKCCGCGAKVELSDQEVEDLLFYSDPDEYLCDACADAKHADDQPVIEYSGHHPDCQCNECYYGPDAAKWLFNPSEY